MGITYKEAPHGWRRVTNGSKDWTATACCDCGLVHGNQYRIRGGKIERRTWRDEKRTAMIRRHMTKRGDMVRISRAGLYVLPLRLVARKRPASRATVKIRRV